MAEGKNKDKDLELIESQISFLKSELKTLAEQANIKIDVDVKDYQEITKQIASQVSLTDKGYASTKQMLKLQEERLKNERLLMKLKGDLKADDEEKFRLLIKSNVEKQIALDDQKKENDQTKEILKSNLGIKENVTSIGLKYQEIKDLKTKTLDQDTAIALKQQLQNQIVSNITESIVKLSGAILDKALEFEGAAKSLMRAGTFTFEESKTGLMAVTQQSAIAGVGLKEASAAMVGLKTSFTGFTNLTGAQQNKITALTATMERMGLSVNASAKFLDTATKSLGMSTTQAAGFLSSLEGFAKQSGIPLAELSKNLEGATDKIALFGDKGTEVFKEMSLASKQLGIDMNTLFNITERFTTFEGAADAAGKLNAILGGDFINSVDLLTASMENPTEAFKMLKMSMDQSGKSFDEMDNGMKRVIASSIGMTVEQAGKLFSQDINTATAAMREQAKTQEELARIGADMTTITEKFQNALILLYPTIEPIIDALAKFGMFVIDYVIKPLSWFLSLTPVLGFLQGFGIVVASLGGILAAFGAIFIPIYTMFASYQKIMAVVRGETELFSAIKKKDAAASLLQAEAETANSIAKNGSIGPTKGAGNAARSASSGFLALGAGILLIGLGIALVIGSVALLASQIKGLSSEQMNTLLIVTFGVTLAFVTFAIVAAKLSGPLLLAAASVEAFGIAMFIAAIPISIVSLVVMLMANRLTEMAVAMKNAGVELAKLGADTMVSNFQAIETAFKGIATHINSIDAIKLAALAAAGMFSGGTVFAGATPQQGRSVDLNMTVTDVNTGQTATSGGGATGAAGNQIIHLNIDIKSPIELKGKNLGEFVHQETKVVMLDARSPGIRPSS